MHILVAIIGTLLFAIAGAITEIQSGGWKSLLFAFICLILGIICLGYVIHDAPPGTIICTKGGCR